MAIKQLGATPTGPTDAARLADVPRPAKGATTTTSTVFPTTAAAVPELTFELAPGTYLVSGMLLLSKSAAANAPRVQIGDEDAVGLTVSVLGISMSAASTALVPTAVAAANTSIGATTTATTGIFITLAGTITVPTGAATWTVSIRTITSGTGTATLAAGSSVVFTPTSP